MGSPFASAFFHVSELPRGVTADDLPNRDMIFEFDLSKSNRPQTGENYTDLLATHLVRAQRENWARRSATDAGREAREQRRHAATRAPSRKTANASRVITIAIRARTRTSRATARVVVATMPVTSVAIWPIPITATRSVEPETQEAPRGGLLCFSRPALPEWSITRGALEGALSQGVMRWPGLQWVRLLFWLQSLHATPNLPAAWRPAGDVSGLQHRVGAWAGTDADSHAAARAPDHEPDRSAKPNARRRRSGGAGGLCA